MKLKALRPTDVKEVEYRDSGVIFKIRPLPYKVKQDIVNESTQIYFGKKTINMAELAIKVVKYGCVGWDNLQYEDGTDCQPVLVDCPTYKVRCLDDESIEILYRVSAFDEISNLCNNQHEIEEYVEKWAKVKEEEKKKESSQ